MPVLRNGRTADEFATPDIYFEEQDPSQNQGGQAKPPKVMAIVGTFQKGSINEILSVTKDNFNLIAGEFSSKYTGSMAAYASLKAGVARLLLINIRGAGATKATASINNNAASPVAGLEITRKDTGDYGNQCTYSVEAGRESSTFRIILEGPYTPREIYDNLTSFAEAAEAINSNKSSEFVANNVYNGDEANDFAATVNATKFTNGSDGSKPTATHYKGSTDSATGLKTGNELLRTSIEATDIVYDTWISDVANTGLLETADKMNGFAYMNTESTISVASASTLRASFDSEYGHLAIGFAKSRSMGFSIPVAVYDCIAHVLSLPQDGTAGFWFEDVESVSVLLTDEDIDTLTRNNIVCMGQMINEKGDKVFGMKNDYTLSKNEALKQTYRRRTTSLIEKELYIALTPYRSKHISSTWEEDVEIVVRDFFNLKKESELIKDYSVKFATPGTTNGLDEFIIDLRVSLFNIADKIRVRLLSMPNATEGGSN